MKVRQKNWSGKEETLSVSAAVAREIGRAGGHGYGQIEQIQAELNATQEVLFNLIEILEDSLTKEDILKLVGSYGNEVVDDDGSLDAEPGVCVYCGAAASGEFTIHRDGMDMGPEVDLCNTCGGTGSLTCDEIWERIRLQGVARRRTS